MRNKTIVTLAVAALGIGLVAITAGSAHADYPPTSAASIVVAATSPTVAPGGTTPIAAVVQDSTGSRVAGTLCSFAIASQPGSDASVADARATTNSNGIATTTLNVGSTPGSIVVNAQCGTISSATTVVAGASVSPAPARAGLPSTGTGTGTDGSASAMVWLVLGLMAFTGLGALHLARRAGR
jgi:hypothetical protein